LKGAITTIEKEIDKVRVEREELLKEIKEIKDEAYKKFVKKLGLKNV
jgi:hypothetical protein